MKSVLIACLLILSSATALADKSAGESVDDTWLHTKVKAKLVGFGTRKINLEVYQGVVLMAGFVRSNTEREAAEAQAASVKGVVRVSNQLVVQPQSRRAGQTLDDGVIAGKVKAELADDERTGAYDINVEVRNGEVLLSGFVHSGAERNAALNVAQNIEGVEKVINGMDVPPEDRKPPLRTNP